MAIDYGAGYDSNTHRFILKGVEDKVDAKQHKGINCYKNGFTQTLTTLLGLTVQVEIGAADGKKEIFILNKKSLEKFLARNGQPVEENKNDIAFYKKALKSIASSAEAVQQAKNASVKNKYTHTSTVLLQIGLNNPHITVSQLNILQKELVRLGLIDKKDIKIMTGNPLNIAEDSDIELIRQDIVEPALKNVAKVRNSSHLNENDKAIINLLNELSSSPNKAAEFPEPIEHSETDTLSHPKISLTTDQNKIKAALYNLLNAKGSTAGYTIHIELDGKTTHALVHDIAQEKNLIIDQGRLNKLSESSTRIISSRKELIEFIEQFFTNEQAFDAIYPEEIISKSKTTKDKSSDNIEDLTNKLQKFSITSSDKKAASPKKVSFQDTHEVIKETHKVSEDTAYINENKLLLEDIRKQAFSRGKIVERADSIKARLSTLSETDKYHTDILAIKSAKTNKSVIERCHLFLKKIGYIN